MDSSILIKHLRLLLLSFICIPQFCFAQSLESEIQAIVDRYQAVGASVAVVKDNQLVYTRSFGYNPDYNDLSLKMAIPANGVYFIASISKTVISTAIMHLVDKNILKLDDDANKYLDFNLRNPKYPQEPITIKMLLSHRSSINNNHYGTLNNINPDKGKNWQDCYNSYKPGSKFQYCNYNYSILGAIIENATGQKFFDYVDENINEPLGLNASFNLTKIDSSLLVRSLIYDSDTKTFKKDNTIYNYQYYRNHLKNYKLGFTEIYFSPSGGMKISAVDLSKYMRMHMNYGEFEGKRILSEKADKELWKPVDADTTYALGFFRNSTILDGDTIVGVRGSAHGIHSAMYFSPKKKFGFVVICNGCTSDVSMKDGIVRTLYKHLINRKEE